MALKDNGADDDGLTAGGPLMPPLGAGIGSGGVGAIPRGSSTSGSPRARR